MRHSATSQQNDAYSKEIKLLWSRFETTIEALTGCTLQRICSVRRQLVEKMGSDAVNCDVGCGHDTNARCLSSFIADIRIDS